VLCPDIIETPFRLFYLEVAMPGWLNWALIAAGLILGVLGGLLGAWVSTTLYWVLWIPGLGCVAAFVYLSDRPAVTEAPAPTEVPKTDQD
jgi:hypothetical protein